MNNVDKIKHDSVVSKIVEFIPNNLGINLCSVKDIDVKRQEDGQLTEINITFIPSDAAE